MKENLYFSYVIKLLAKVQRDIAHAEHQKALENAVKAFTHIDHLVKTPRARGDISLEMIEDYRVRFVKSIASITKRPSRDFS